MLHAYVVLLVYDVIKQKITCGVIDVQELQAIYGWSLYLYKQAISLRGAVKVDEKRERNECGEFSINGNCNKSSVLLNPPQMDDQLIWNGSVLVPPWFNCDYCYYLVDVLKNILRSEFGELTGRRFIQLHDLWQSGNQATPFRKVILHHCCDMKAEKHLGVFENKLELDESVAVKSWFIAEHTERNFEQQWLSPTTHKSVFLGEAVICLLFNGKSIFYSKLSGQFHWQVH